MIGTVQILLLTATITPPSSVPNLIRTNPAIRLQDYEKALAFYMTLIDQGVDYIVLVDNSNSDSSTLQNLVKQSNVSDRVELLSFYGLDYPTAYGKGYGEFKLVDYAMANSRIINQEKSNAVIWKVTGRYVVKNLAQVINQRPTEFDIYCNFRLGLTRPLHKFKLLKWMDMFLMAWTYQGYNSFIRNIYKELRADHHGEAEIRFRELLEPAPKNLNVITRYTAIPFIDGVRGFDGQNFSHGSNLWKYYSRRLTHSLIPSMWI